MSAALVSKTVAAVVSATVSDVLRALQTVSSNGRYPARLVPGRGEVGCCPACGTLNALGLTRSGLQPGKVKLTTDCACDVRGVLRLLVERGGL